MAITEHQIRTQPSQTQGALPAPLPATRRLTNGWALTLGLAWVAFNVLAAVLEPAPAQTTIAWWESLVVMAQVGALGLVAAGLARRTSWAGAASLAGATFFTVGVFACPATGHHAFGVWWFGEFAAVLALTTLSAVAYVRTRAA